MRANAARLTNLFDVYDQKIKPVTQKIRKMLIAKKLGLMPAPTPEQIDREKEEFFNRVLPMLSNALTGRQFFCGDSITGYDLQIYCELKSIVVCAEENFSEELNK